jgi:hypothetical protein
MLSDYELQRERNIASNKKRLAELGLEGGLALKKKKAAPKPKRQRADPDWKPERTTRVSGRPAAAAVKNERTGDSGSDGSDDDDDDDDEDIPLPKRVLAAKPEVKPKEAKQPSETSDLCITVEAAKTGRSKCRGCMTALEQGEMRVGMESWMVGRAVTVWQHPRCCAERVVVTVESSGRGKCKQTKVGFAVGEAKLSCTAHNTTAHFKPAAVAAQLRQVFALAGRSVESIEGFKLLSAEDARALRSGVPVRAPKPEPEPQLELEATPSQAVALKEEGAPAQPAKGSVSRAKGKVCWRFAGHLCYGALLPAQESKTHCYARTHKGNTKTLTKGGASWWMVES